LAFPITPKQVGSFIHLLHPSRMAISGRNFSMGWSINPNGYTWGWKIMAWMTQHPSMHHPKNLILGFHEWGETKGQFIWSLVFFFLAFIFFPEPFFSLVFFLVSPSLNPNFFLGTPTYSSNLPTSFPPPNPSTSS
jgi:hypothetical protein